MELLKGNSRIQQPTLQKRHPDRSFFYLSYPRLVDFDVLPGHRPGVEGQRRAQNAIGQLGPDGLHVHRVRQAEVAAEAVAVGFGTAKDGRGWGEGKSGGYTAEWP